MVFFVNDLFKDGGDKIVESGVYAGNPAKKIGEIG